MKIGIIGAGRIGRALAAHGVRCGHEVMLSNSRGADSLRDAAIELRCQAGTPEQAAAFGEVVALALPFCHFRAVPAVPLRGKVVLDANNYYPQRDGQHPDLDEGRTTTSEMVAAHLHGARIVKAFNAILADDLEQQGLPAGSPGRRALPLAGDDAEARATAASLVDAFGFDPLDCGALSEGWRFERARPVYCVPLGRAVLEAALAGTRRDSFVPLFSWHRDTMER
ncbi:MULTISPECIES: NADPH-dependent F420 reductase [unclassified Variovorax]|uniref:NADPH-dependent F420 reductase n=1 Tax=unclassified Variovorax TaxID=663243 RepID=UPI001BD1BFE7|nr:MULTISPECIES: NAD(P)-binding domain-containing protein [unclassified Variovorax]